MLKAQDIADYFLFKNKIVSEDDEGLSNLKLQKLLYYAQGFHIAMYKKPLFQEAIEAWIHGPVVPEVYHTYKHYGSVPIQFNQDIDLEKYDKDTQDLISEVNRIQGQFAAWKLRNMTHEEPPWKNTQLGKIIEHKLLESYFETLLVDEENTK